MPKAGLGPAAGTSASRQRRGHGPPKEVHDQLEQMYAAAEPFVADAGRRAYWKARWETYVVLAAGRANSNRGQFYWLRSLAVGSSVVVPSLVGLNLSGTGGVAVRWVTFGLSLVAALSTAALALFRFGDRWFLYRRLQDDLLRVGWALIGKSPGSADEAWPAFVASTEAAVASYVGAYETDVITAAQPKDAEAKK